MVDQSEFLKRMNVVFAGQYDFSKSVYVKALEKLEVVCPTHGSFFAKPNSLYRGSGCPKCAVDKVGRKSRLRLEDVKKDLLRIHGDKITFPKIETEFVDSHSKLTVNCNVHGESGKVSVQELKKTSGCPKCGYLARSNNIRITSEGFKKRVSEKHGVSLIPHMHTYTSLSADVRVSCLKHGAFTTKASSLYRGYGCKKCANEANGKKRSFSEDEIRRALVGKPVSLIRLYKTKRGTQALMLCQEHGEYKTQAASIMAGRGCLKCSAKIRGLKTVVCFDEFISRAKVIHGDKYTYCRDRYTSISEGVVVTCKDHGEFTQRGSDHIHKGSGCPACGVLKDSKPQIEISKFIERFGYETVRNYKFSDSKHEIDVFIPELKIAIEYNGIYFHTQQFRKSSGYHIEKTKLAAKHGIRLVHLFSDEWENNQLACESYLMNLIGVRSQFSKYARKCEIGDVTQDIANDFYTANHIQGACWHGINVGLFDKNVLIALMTFSKKASGRKVLGSGDWELVRFASSENVVGGASRLFKALLNKTRADRVISFSDNRLFSGGVYERMRFTKDIVYPPNYAYVDRNGSQRLHKSRFQHKHLKTLLGDAYDPTKTEKENCESAGYYRIYDCGLTRWVWSKGG
jgi:predicted Zn-ribbon and HTH transcriptional regulator